MTEKKSREKMRKRLLELRHRPLQRGGNGRLLPLPQLALLHALGEGWKAELPIKTAAPAGSGLPTAYKVDIANEQKKIAIEVDGMSHRTPGARDRDARKMAFLAGLGWRVYRVSNEKALRLYSTFVSVDTLLTLLMES